MSWTVLTAADPDPGRSTGIWRSDWVPRLLAAQWASPFGFAPSATGTSREMLVILLVVLIVVVLAGGFGYGGGTYRGPGIGLGAVLLIVLLVLLLTGGVR